MQEIIKYIRSELNLSPAQLGRMLDTSADSVVAWERGASLPEVPKQRLLYTLCRKSIPDIADFVVENAAAPPGEGLILYHASRKGISGNIQPISRRCCDFGIGFYLGTDPLQPLTLVCNEAAPVFYTLRMNAEGLRCLDLDVGLDWAMLIAYFRGYMEEWQDTSLYSKYAHMTDGYDVIIGYIANDRMYRVLTDFFEGRLTDTALIAGLSALKLGRQYVAKTAKACEHISLLHEKKLFPFELMVLQDRSALRRREGLATTDNILRIHRRDGRFFDEIMRGVEP